ncbi:DEAD/DEAH box helicase [Bifidobacterium italicum]|nr:DEAD/DEAH box helicase [Bifidobacterium italicum]
MQDAMTFAELGVDGPIVHLLADEGKRAAFPIQQDTLPDSLAGRDVLGRGRTGSGKTLAFAIPLVTRVAASFDDDREHGRREPRGAKPHPRGLVLAPTRELANQINDVVAPLAALYGMTTTTVYGGVRYARQFRDLNDGAQIVVACPGRLEDLIEQGALTLDDVRVVVLDEADEMADMGFLPPIKRLLAQIPRGAQHMLFSATLDHGVDAVVDEFLDDPKVHSVDEATDRADLMTHHVFLTTKADKNELVRALASGKGRRILFTRTKFQAKKLAKALTQRGIPAAELHGNLSQNQRDRNLQAFESGATNVLVATDVAARGIDVSGVELVIQVDPPDDPKSFLHRSGRTARAGRAGDVVTIVTPDQKRYARGLLRRAGLAVKPLEVRPDSPQVAELVGEAAPLVEGWELPELERRRAARPRGRRPERREARQSRSAKARRNQTRTRERNRELQRQIDDERREFAQRFLGDVHSVRGEETDAAAPAKRDAQTRGDRRHDEGRRGGKRIHRREQRIVRDERGEDAKRQERREEARRRHRQENADHAKSARRGGSKRRNGGMRKRANGKRRSTPFRMR